MKTKEILFLGLLLAVVSIGPILAGSQQKSRNPIATTERGAPTLLLPLTSAGWQTPAPPITITGDDDWINGPYKDWVNGSGTWSDPYVLRNLTIDGGSNYDCISIASTTKPFVIENCSFSTIGGSFDCVRLFSVSNATIFNNTCMGQSYISISLTTSTNVTISENTIHLGMQEAILLESASTNNTVVGNTIFGSPYYGIKVVDSGNNTIQQNYCEDCSTDGIYAENSGNMTITGNNCSNNGVAGIGVTGGSDNCTVSANNCTWDQWYGIHVASSANETISGNLCQGPDDPENNFDGIYLESSSFDTISSNTCPCPGWSDVPISINLDGIYLESSSFDTLSGNTCPCPWPLVPEVGIYLDGWSDNNTIASNTCDGLNSTGIWLDDASNPCANNTLAGNNCSGNYFDGIDVSIGCDNTTLVGNNCSGNYYNGIDLYGNYGLLVNNTCTWNGASGTGAGINLTSSANSTLQGNLCAHSAGDGINVTASDNCTLANNTCTSNDNTVSSPFYGIHLNFSRHCVLTANNCSKNTKGSGIYLYDSSNSTLTANICGGNRDAGLYLNTTSNCSVSWNNCTTNAIGINLTSSNNDTCSWNICSQNTGWGMHLDAASTYNYVFFNFVKHNANYGIQASGSPNSIHDNYFNLVAGFSNTTPIVGGQAVPFTDQTANGSSLLQYQWNFGDGTGNSTTQNPTHLFAVNPVYIITLMVTDADGDVSVASATFGVIAPPAPALKNISPNPSTIGTIELSWSAVSGATSYNLYRYTSPITSINSSVVLVVTTRSTAATDTGLTNGTYYYAVTVVIGNWESNVSNCQSVTIAILPASTVPPPTNNQEILIIIAVVAVIVALALAFIAIPTLLKKKKMATRRFVSTTVVTPQATIPAAKANDMPVTSEDQGLQTPVEETSASLVASIPLSDMSEDESEKAAVGESGVYAFRGGRIVGSRFIYKVKVKNATDMNITDVGIQLVSYPRDCMRLVTQEDRHVSKIEPGGFRSLEFELQPQKDCVEGALISSVNYLDAKNELFTIHVKPFVLKSVCDLMEPLVIPEAAFDALVSPWASTQEVVTFKGEDSLALAEDVPAILESKNFHPVSHQVQEEGGTLNSVTKGIATGKYTKRRLAVTIRIDADVKSGDGSITCTGHAEDESMLVACLSELLAEFRKPLVRQLRKILKDRKGVANLEDLRAELQVELPTLADAVRQEPDFVFLHGGEQVATYTYLVDFLNAMRVDYDTVPVADLEAELRPAGKTMQGILQELIAAGKLRAIWVGASEIRFKTELHKVALRTLYTVVAFISGVVTIIIFLLNYLK